MPESKWMVTKMIKSSLALVIVLITIAVAWINSAQAESNVTAFVGPKIGAEVLKPTGLSMNGGLTVGAEGGLKIGNLGNATLNLATSMYDSDTQITHYMLGFSREIIWGINLSIAVGLQSVFDRDLADGATRIPSPTGTNLAYGGGISYLTQPILTFRKDIELQLMPEAVAYLSSNVNWYSVTANFRFNFLQQD